MDEHCSTSGPPLQPKRKHGGDHDSPPDPWGPQAGGSDQVTFEGRITVAHLGKLPPVSLNDVPRTVFDDFCDGPYPVVSAYLVAPLIHPHWL